MKAKLEFNLPEEKTDFNLAIKSFAWYRTLLELDNQLRNWLKYGHDFKNTDAALNAIRTLITDSMHENNISFDDVD